MTDRDRYDKSGRRYVGQTPWVPPRYTPPPRGPGESWWQTVLAGLGMVVTIAGLWALLIMVTPTP